MTGASFQSLFARIRRTQSTLVLRHVAREEVFTRFQERLTSAAENLLKAWRQYQSLNMLDPEPGHPSAEIGRQRNTFRKKLRKPAPGINVLNLTEATGVDLKEVYLRGKGREAPASKNGEELRDVILWLSEVAYAKQTGERLAFVSADSGSGGAPVPRSCRTSTVRKSTSHFSKAWVTWL
jgi:hypothetical protein